MFIGFSKALPVGKSVIPDDSGTLRTQAPVPILLAHLCDDPGYGHSLSPCPVDSLLFPTPTSYKL